MPISEVTTGTPVLRTMLRSTSAAPEMWIPPPDVEQRALGLLQRLGGLADLAGVALVDRVVAADA